MSGRPPAVEPPAPAPSTAAPSALQLAEEVARRRTSARALVERTLADIDARDGHYNAFTLVTRERALAEADAVDEAAGAGRALPPLAGVPYAVKNLFDVAGEVTTAGSKVNRANPPAAADSALVERMRAAGAVLVGALNMDEFAYGFTTENSHDGAARNPHDTTRVAGGSSGGSGAAVAAGLVPLALGTDTNGSIRVPASLCGVYGLKPTYGRLSRRGAFPFVASLDHVGPFARSVADLAACYDALQGADPRDPACAGREREPVAAELPRGSSGLRIGVLGGYFDEMSGPLAREAVARVARQLGARTGVELPLAAEGRAAAFVITGAEGGALHLPGLRARYDDYEPLSRDRFIAGSLTPAAWYLRAQRVRAAYARAAAELFRQFDVLVAAATPVEAQPIGTEWLDLNGLRLPARASMGVLTQPISCIGLPVLAAPVPLPGRLPIAVQLIAAPWREADAFRVAAELERAGVSFAPPPARQ
jgi:aspartyl-tRNA(Asn)/glutamyl-tRNA(Gln) amidotransferase subunit A